jgi:endonuclease YncB( thermonuclease family)
MLAERVVALRVVKIALAVALAGALAALAPVAAQERGCSAGDGEAVVVKAVSDGRTLILADGREMRLASIEIPTAIAAAAADALKTMIDGREVAASPLTPASDRYGRSMMRTYINGSGGRQWVERLLVAQGLALRAARADDTGCAAALKAAERSARQAKLGLWSQDKADAMKADNPAAVLGLRGSFALVDGRVMSVRESGATIYVNFGRRWSEDFTVTILKRNERKFAAAGIVPRQLEGRRVRIRGMIEERGGPWIEAAVPEQIELAEER